MIRAFQTFLEGCRVLLVEDEFLMAMDLTQVLRDAGATVLGPVPTVAKAMALLDAGPAPDAAVLDINLCGEMAFPVADRLLEGRVPMVFATGYGRADIPVRLGHVPRVEKPLDTAVVARALSRAIKGAMA